MEFDAFELSQFRKKLLARINFHLDRKAIEYVGSLFRIISHLVGLTILNLKSNLLTGTLPTELFQLPLVNLELSGNFFSGTVPTEVGRLSHISDFRYAYSFEIAFDYSLTFSIPYNSLFGTLPSEIGNLSTLTFLDVSTNLFHGSLPSELGNLRSLVSFRGGAYFD